MFYQEFTAKLAQYDSNSILNLLQKICVEMWLGCKRQKHDWHMLLQQHSDKFL